MPLALPLALVALVLCLFQLCINGRSVITEEEMDANSKLCRNNFGSLKFDATLSPMQRTDRLDVCNQYRHNTCCNSTNTAVLKRPVHELRAAGFSDTCRDLTTKMICRPCHPYVGTGQMLRVCPTFCTEWYQACREEYYMQSAMDGGILVPCYGDALICSPLHQIVSNGDEMCQIMRLNLKHVGSSSDDLADDSLFDDGGQCFDGSVPSEVGQPEPTVPLYETIRQNIMEQLFNSESSQSPLVIILATFVVLVFSARRLTRSLFDDTPMTLGAGQEGDLTLEEVRARQQQRYERDLIMANDMATSADSDSSSSDDDEVEKNASHHDEGKKNGSTENDPLGVLQWKEQRIPIIGSNVDS